MRGEFVLSDELLDGLKHRSPPALKIHHMSAFPDDLRCTFMQGNMQVNKSVVASRRMLQETFTRNQSSGDLVCLLYGDHISWPDMRDKAVRHEMKWFALGATLSHVSIPLKSK